jgi:hypothetical protein
MNFKLTDTFIDNYRDKSPAWGPLGEFTYLRTYSRLIEEENRKEKWFETVKRVVEGCFDIQKKHCESLRLVWNTTKAQKSAQVMYDKIFNFKFLPPGRGLWAMGTKFVEEKGGAALNNCLSGDTKIFTDKGLVKLSDIEGLSVKLLDGDKFYTDAIIKSYGMQRLNTYVFKPIAGKSLYRIEVKATQDHRWILSNFLETRKLSIGDKVKSTVLNYASNDSDDWKLGFAHGIIFGDGTRHTYYPERHFIRLCSSRDKQYQSLLESIKGYVSTTYTNNGDPVITIVRKGENWKDLPEEKSYTYMAAFLQGWITADAKEISDGYKLASINKKALDWVASYGPFIGYNVVGYSRWDTTDETNYGMRSAPLYGISLVKRDMEYKVVDIIEGEIEKVYCAEVPTTHSFFVEGGLLTGNCGFVSTEDIDVRGSFAFTWTMDALMLGVGIGFDTKGAGKLRIKEPKEDGVYLITDDREGWVESLRLLLDAFFFSRGLPVFDYSIIRPYGSLIKGFGGIASGPGPLRDMHESITKLLLTRVGEKISSTDIVDIINIISVCVVSGNVRRSACIAIGDYDDQDYVTMKDYKLHPQEVDSHRWASNNSVFAEVGKTDYFKFTDSIALNGEPGVVWLENARKYSRTIDPPDWKDKSAAGVNPCSEQTLENAELCCLVETFPSLHASLEEYKETIKYAYLYGKSVTLIPTHWPETNAILLKNRRIGLSQSGIIDAFVKHGRRTMLQWSDDSYQYVQKLDQIYSDWLCVPRSKKTTTVKPSGTVSLLCGVSPGIHYPHSEYYIRRIRVATDDPIISIMRTAGYEVEKDLHSKNTSIVSFPVHEKYFTKKKADVSIWEQVKNVVDYQRFWADNNVSVTVTFKPEEVQDIPSILQAYEDTLKAISFLPLDDNGYDQMPYEEINIAVYARMTGLLRTPDFTSLTTPASGTRFCENDSCQLTK